jgi:antitoxin component of RelBE/YafQ-DinJ toxin-antitoxin module
MSDVTVKVDTNKIHSIGFKVDKSLYDRFQAVTTTRGINQSFVLRQLLEAWISHEEKKEEAA